MKMTAEKLVEMVERETAKAFPSVLTIKQAVLNAAWLIEEHEKAIEDLKLKVKALQTVLRAKS